MLAIICVSIFGGGFAAGVFFKSMRKSIPPIKACANVGCGSRKSVVCVDGLCPAHCTSIHGLDCRDRMLGKA